MSVHVPEPAAKTDQAASNKANDKVDKPDYDGKARFNLLLAGIFLMTTIMNIVDLDTHTSDLARDVAGFVAMFTGFVSFFFIGAAISNFMRFYDELRRKP
jgi:hypothetical protein